MNFGSKISATVLAGILFYLGVSAYNGYFSLNNDLLKGESKHLPVCLYVETPNYVNLTEPVKKHLKSFKNFTVNCLRFIVNEPGPLWKHAELSVSNNDAGYLRFSKDIFYSLEIRVIIFPFHFFG